MDKEVRLRIAAVAAGQHGAFVRQTAIEAGATSADISRQVRQGLWVRPVPGVYLVSGSPSTWNQAVTVAVFGSGRSAIASQLPLPTSGDWRGARRRSK